MLVLMEEVEITRGKRTMWGDEWMKGGWNGLK
jgi:hypothetical protein